MPVALALVAAVHLGFQATVTVVLYPALSEVPDAAWTTAHRRHSTRISVLVGPVYLAVAVICLLSLLAGPDDAATWVALGAEGLALLITAALAAPAHGRLGDARPEDRQQLLHRLLAVDRGRLVAASLGAIAATMAVLGQ